MSEDLVVRYGAPTLAGIKTGSLFTCPSAGRRATLLELRAANAALRPKGLRLIALRFMADRVLLYLYRPASLKKDLSDAAAQRILKEAGYGEKSASGCIAELIRRLHTQHDFPHEIGLFLSYPPEDVRGFIAHKACGYKCSGLWKVYGDEASAQKTFRLYQKCTDVYCRQRQKGVPVTRLAVAK